MMEPGRSLLACTAAAALACAGIAAPVPQAQGGGRGVRVLLPDAQPTPAPTPQPGPTPAVAPRDVAPIVAPPAPPRACDRAFAAADLTLSDTATFDRALGDLLARKPARVVIDVPDRFDPAAPPPRLRPWLAQVADGGGAVTATEIGCGRGFGFGKLLGKLFARRQPAYEAVRGYDAILWYDKAGTKVTQVQFTRRS